MKKNKKLDGLMPFFFNTKQVCEMLNMSRQGVSYCRLHLGLPYYSLGYKTRRYNRKDFMKWMAKREMNNDA